MQGQFANSQTALQFLNVANASLCSSWSMQSPHDRAMGKMQMYCLWDKV